MTKTQKLLPLPLASVALEGAGLIGGYASIAAADTADTASTSSASQFYMGVAEVGATWAKTASAKKCLPAT